ncbi:MAG: DNA-processing protein DprA [Gammaproteobacteria bacterium]|nr:DNA-processing protein DprA [Gammaproteobacteria bacterium]MCB1905292.1 DNA-processing protein DprA [Gammaproteobacteria bacterium]
MEDSYAAEAETLKYWLALVRIPALGSIRINRLLDRFTTPEALFREAAGSAACPGVPESVKPYLRNPPWKEVERDLQWLEQPGHHLLTRIDVRFPMRLKQIADPPVLLYVEGDPGLLSSVQLAIVGSRNPTATGRSTARQFARSLSAAGLTVTSGMATGIDGAAHEGALEELAATIAVTGTGLDRIYPGCHAELAHRIATHGALVSEFPIGTPVRRGHFPRRNRIISGLTLGTLVVEAARGSGSLITAREAADQGREVFAVPGSIHNPLARGCHQLIRQGAKLVETAQDILEELAPMLGYAQAHSALPEALHSPDRWDPVYRQLLSVLEFDPLPNDLLIERSGLTAETVSSMLLLLELQGYVSSEPGRGYCLTLKYDPDAAN